MKTTNYNTGHTYFSEREIKKQKIIFDLSKITLLVIFFLSITGKLAAQSFVDINAISTGSYRGGLAWGDYDNDGDLDFMLAGQYNFDDSVSVLHKNNLDLANTLPNVPTKLSANTSGSSVTLSWSKATDTETAQDGLTYNVIIGTSSGGTDILSGMVNASTGFRRIAAIGNACYNDSITISNLNAGKYYWSVQAIDNHFKGYSFLTERTSQIEGFTDIAAGLSGTQGGSAYFVDYDNDGDLDAMISGTSGSGRITKFYDNDGSGNFSDNSKGLPSGIAGEVSLGDYDNDGDLDIAICGYTSGDNSQIYQNTAGTFSNISAGLTNVSYSHCAWGDYDNDGDLDLALAGKNGSTRIAKIYQNNSGTFSDISAGFTGMDYPYIDWGDYDNDGDLDLAICGFIDGSTPESKIYQNTDGSFSDISAGLTGLGNGAIVWGDYDNDGDLDLVVTGADNSYTGYTKIYQNTGGSFSDISAGLDGAYTSSAVWGDYDNDGDLDLVISGNFSGTHETKIYQNNSGSFSDINAGLTGIYSGQVSFGDYDDDGDLDIILAGRDGTTRYAKIYENHRNTSNTSPNAPTNLQTSVNNNSVTFSWDKATDTETSQNGLTYNVRIGTTTGGSDILFGIADASTGFRRIAETGNAGHNNSLTIKDLSTGIYYWSVQTIDNAYEGSAFASEGTLIIASATFNGAVNSNWSESGNWSLSALPTSSDDIAIPAGLSNYPAISTTSSANVNDLLVEPGASLIIESDASNTGSLIVSGTFSGSITAKRYMTGAATGWHLIGVPVGGQSIKDFIDNASNSFSTNSTQYGLGVYNEASDTWTTYTSSTYGSAGDLVAGRGYETNIQTDGTLSFVGSVNTSQVDIAITRSGNGWNLLGNPYPCALYANDPAHSTNNFIDINTAVLDDSYEALYFWNASTSQYDIINNASSATYIPNGQAFFVKSVSGGGTASFTTAMRVHQTSATFKTTVAVPQIILRADNGEEIKSTEFRFIEGTTPGLDPGYDAGMFNGNTSGFQLYSRLMKDNEVAFALQCLPTENYDANVIPLEIYATTNGIEFSADFSAIPEQISVYLEDRLHQSFIKLGDETYSTHVETGTVTKRFYLHTSSQQLGETELPSNQEYRIIPNAKASNIRISGELNKIDQLEIYDLSGRPLYKTVLNNREVISLPKLGNGLYVVKLYGEEVDFSQKINWIN